MGLKNVWEVCKFSDEIVYGKLDMSKFAVELHSVLDGLADKTYTDPKLQIDDRGDRKTANFPMSKDGEKI